MSGGPRPAIGVIGGLGLGFKFRGLGIEVIGGLGFGVWGGLGLYGHNGKEHGNYRDYWDYLGIIGHILCG